MDLVEVLAGEIGPRPAGSAAAARAAAAVADAFRDVGVEARFQEFPFVAYEPDDPLLEIDGDRWEAAPVMYGRDADVEGAVRRIGTHVVLPGLFEPAAFAIEMGGREAARIYGNPLGGGATPFPTGYGPTLTGPGVFVSAADAARLPEGAWATLRCGGRLVPTTERNVLAEVAGDTDETIVACAHYDSAWHAGGAVDNASGVEVVRRVLERLGGRRHRRRLLAIAFGAEELGVSGARYFVAEAKTRGELRHIKAVVNVECVGRGERLELWASPEELQRRAVSIAQSTGLGELPTRPAIAGSDHYPFAQEQIAAACVIRWPYAEYHLPEDLPPLVDAAALDDASELVTSLVAELLSDRH